MDEFFNWLTTSPLGLAAVIGGLLLIFFLIAVIYERGTHKRFPDRAKNSRGNKGKKK